MAQSGTKLSTAKRRTGLARHDAAALLFDDGCLRSARANRTCRSNFRALDTHKARQCKTQLPIMTEVARRCHATKA
jgi:hypothetical protein